jgi:anaerobic sulfite reductase subunit A
MGFLIQPAQMDALIDEWRKTSVVYAPRRFVGGDRFSDTDCIRYGEISSIGEAELAEKSQYSFKEALTPVSQTLFFFTEDEVKEPNARKKSAVIFLRSCDIHALKRLDYMYLKNGNEDYYYSRLRRGLKLVLIGCPASFENCFCVSMGTNRTDDYDMSIDLADGGFRADCRDGDWAETLRSLGCPEADAAPDFVTENPVKVHIPEDLDSTVAKSRIWNEYDSRCINCGRCNFVCPTCTCFTMQDLYYSENGRVGERRRVWASCMVDGFTDVAGGGSYRKKNGERMRFKVLHKALDFKKRAGVPDVRRLRPLRRYLSGVHFVFKLPQQA